MQETQATPPRSMVIQRTHLLPSRSIAYQVMTYDGISTMPPATEQTNFNLQDFRNNVARYWARKLHASQLIHITTRIASRRVALHYVCVTDGRAQHVARKHTRMTRMTSIKADR